MNRRRYDGYRAVEDAIVRQALAEYPAGVLRDLAAGLLLARDENEARRAAAPVPDSLASLVDRGELSRFAAHRFWVLLKACGPRVSWPAAWDHPMAASRPWAVQDR
jgi:hypothetical protein